MAIYLCAVFMGVVAGLRALTVPAAVSWAARFGVLNLHGSFLAFLGYAWTPWILTVLALSEYVTDQLASTPSRTVAPQFAARLLTGALAGAALCMRSGNWVTGAALGVGGAVVGTLAGHSVRAQLAKAFGRDRPAALLEDIVAIAGVALIIAVAV